MLFFQAENEVQIELNGRYGILLSHNDNSDQTDKYCSVFYPNITEAATSEKNTVSIIYF